jgi:ubiquinone/menaquinone biosynthesis C-methylase UbiE
VQKATSIGYLNFFDGGCPALALLQQAGLLDAPRDDTSKILDHACGMGLITSLVHEVTDIGQRSSPTKFICGDISLGAIRATEAKIEQLGWKGVTAKIIAGCPNLMLH